MSNADSIQPPTKEPLSPIAQEVEAQFEEFETTYGGSLDEDGRDKYASRRGITKPGN